MEPRLCLQMQGSLGTVALDLAARPDGPDTRLKLNYRLVALGGEEGFIWLALLCVTLIRTYRAWEEMSWDLRRKMPVSKQFLSPSILPLTSSTENSK